MEHKKTIKPTTGEDESTKTPNDTASCFSAREVDSSLDYFADSSTSGPVPKSTMNTATQKPKTRKFSNTKKTKKAKSQKSPPDVDKRTATTLLKTMLSISTTVTAIATQDSTKAENEPDTATKEQVHKKKTPRGTGIKGSKISSNVKTPTTFPMGAQKAEVKAQTQASRKLADTMAKNLPDKEDKVATEFFKQILGIYPQHSSELTFDGAQTEAIYAKTSNQSYTGVTTSSPRYPSGQDEGCSRNHERSMTSKRHHEIDADGFQLVRAGRYRPSRKVPVRSAWERYCKRKNGNKHGGHNRRPTPTRITPLENKAKSRETVAEGIEAETGDVTVSYAYLMALEATFTEDVLTKVIFREAIIREIIATEKITTDLFFRESIATRRVPSESRITEVFGSDRSVPSIMAPVMSSSEEVTPEQMRFEEFVAGELASEVIHFEEVAIEDMLSAEGVLETITSDIVSDSTEAENIPSGIIRHDTIGCDTVVSDMAPEITAMDSRAPATTNGQMWFATNLPSP
ncbi:hypothetical protein JCM33374_g261 [Metschnikowia sp. JCM 33374]|nr:hypothetical protein JCM33374_g261 [Metschnikowia sp. JCM 33374]